MNKYLTEILNKMTQSEKFIHTAVLLEEGVNSLAIQPDGIYIDATFGRGGHSQKIVQQLGKNGRLICIDKDPEAIAAAYELFSQDERVTIKQGSFRSIQQIATDLDIIGKVNGILFDLGISSPQIDDPKRGFSFSKEGPLDMRMDPQTGKSAKEWINAAKVDEIAWVLKRFGEEKFAKRIARNIVTARTLNPIETTTMLSQIISQAIPIKDKHKHPATRSFQAIRIFINQELEDLTEALEAVPNLLAPKGRLAVITFHSLEDKIVKRFMEKNTTSQLLSKIPLRQDEIYIPFTVVHKRIEVKEVEKMNNVRARSAKLRVLEKNSKNSIKGVKL